MLIVLFVSAKVVGLGHLNSLYCVVWLQRGSGKTLFPIKWTNFCVIFFPKVVTPLGDFIGKRDDQ